MRRELKYVRKFYKFAEQLKIHFQILKQRR